MSTDLMELLNFLEQVHLDERERYVMQISDSHGVYDKIINREEYLEFVVENALTTIGELIGDTESDNS